MTRHLVSLVAGICILSTTVWTQAALPIAVDQRVRVTTADGTHIGRVIAIAPDSVRLSIDDQSPVSIDRPSIRSIEVSRDRESKTKKYAIRGAIIAGLIGAISLGLQHESVGEDGSSAGKAAALGAFSGGLFGGLIGGAIGAAKSADRWEHVWP